MNSNFLILKNGGKALLKELPIHSIDTFRKILLDATEKEGKALSAFFAVEEKSEDKCFLLTAILRDDEKNELLLAGAYTGPSYTALSSEAPRYQWFEREIAEQYGIIPLGHPNLKEIRFHNPLNGAESIWNDRKEKGPAVTDYFTYEGEECHEVAVGPVHAGVIEPGHFRFQCMGEKVYSLEIELGYQHRGIEQMLIGGPDKKTLPVMETIAGDSTIAHTLAHCILRESLGDLEVPARAEALRVLALELERIANGVGDCGALAGDVAFLPTASYCGRIRGEYLNMTALLCGNRFGRNFLTPGGVNFDLDEEDILKLKEWLKRIRPEIVNALELLFDTPSVLDRFEGTGALTKEIAKEIGLVGGPARACDLSCDIRKTHPFGYFKDHTPPAESGQNGCDVLARARIRQQDILASESFISGLLEVLPKGEITTEKNPGEKAPLAASSIAVSLVEGWRGEVLHCAITDEEGKIRRYKVVDPSFHNWWGLALALRGEEISHFPICNKSFNLSYCGHDL